MYTKPQHEDRSVASSSQNICSLTSRNLFANIKIDFEILCVTAVFDLQFYANYLNRKISKIDKINLIYEFNNLKLLSLKRKFKI